MFGCGFLLRKQKKSKKWTTSEVSEEDIPNPEDLESYLAKSEGSYISEKDHQDLIDDAYSLTGSQDTVVKKKTAGWNNCEKELPPHLKGSGSQLWSGDVQSTSADTDPIEVALGRKLGSGISGTVYKGRYGNREVAVKVIRHGNEHLGVSTEPLEAAITRQVSHPNLVKVIEVYRAREKEGWETTSGDEFFIDIEKQKSAHFTCNSFFSEMAQNMESKTNETWIIMELCNRGSLHAAIKKGDFFEDAERTRPRALLVLLTALEIATAMEHLHSFGIIHGDLKTQNVLLMSSNIVAKNFICKVGDFGMSRPLTKLATHVSTFSVGTVSHMPPEVLRDGILTPAADVFSFGMLLWELMSGKSPFHWRSSGDTMVAIVEGSRPSIPKFFPGPFADLIRSCWHHSRENRPNFSTIIQTLNVMLSGPSVLSNRPPKVVTSISFPAPGVSRETWDEYSECQHKYSHENLHCFTTSGTESGKSSNTVVKLNPSSVETSTSISTTSIITETIDFNNNGGDTKDLCVSNRIKKYSHSTPEFPRPEKVIERLL